MNGILWKMKQIMQHVLKKQGNSLLSKYIKLIYRGVFLRAVTCVKAFHRVTQTVALNPFHSTCLFLVYCPPLL